MRKITAVFVLLFAFAHVMYGKGAAVQKKIVKQSAVMQIDSSKVMVRKFDTAAINAYLKQPEFNYHETDKPTSWWERFWDWLWHYLDSLFSKSNKKTEINPGLPIKYLLIALLAGLAIWLVIKLAGIDNIFNRRTKKTDLLQTELVENINDISFNDQIEKAVLAGNYSLAVRFLYLQCLKQLNDANLIHWQIEKTNTAYLNELTNTGQKQHFTLLTRQFEYVWYGGFVIDKPLYEEINTLFINFNKTLA
ncbi:MAG: hypothetical protein JWR50_673 [Mucilaginibacter sp.]|nr:hypothetical protein [Mucilaginibacter sp.]